MSSHNLTPWIGFNRRPSEDDYLEAFVILMPELIIVVIDWQLRLSEFLPRRLGTIVWSLHPIVVRDTSLRPHWFACRWNNVPIGGPIALG
jgi:hypothetical protein